MKYFLLAFLLFSLGASAQVASGGKTFCVNPACPISFAYGATDTVFVQITTSDGLGATYWTQKAGPAIPNLTKDTTVWITGIEGFDGFYLSGLVPGAYTLQDSVVSKTGSVQVAQVSFTVLPAPAACPACPAIPAASARIKSWIIVQSGGIGRIQVTYWDNTTALLP